MCDIVGLTDSIVNLEKNVRKMYKSKKYKKKKKNTLLALKIGAVAVLHQNIFSKIKIVEPY
jgi:hypothetical protein